MTIGYVVTLRDDRADLIDDAANAGAAAAFLRLFDGTQPATGGPQTTLLAELRFSDPAFAGSTNGILVGNSITDDPLANATGTVTWARVTDSNGLAVVDIPASDLNLNTDQINIGVNVSASQFDITEGNP